MDSSECDLLQAELDLIQAAYSPDEVSIQTTNDSSTLVRNCKHHSNTFILRFDCSRYPDEILITGSMLQQSKSSAELNSLVDACKSVSDQGSIFAVLQQADTWLQEHEAIDSDRETKVLDHSRQSATADEVTFETASIPTIPAAVASVISRNMIYSHHIIGKQKRADMKRMASNLKLTGFIKIGWPGLMVIEGTQENVRDFYDTIRRWQWQYLVLRGEMHDDKRLFPPLHEVTDIAIVANHCRQVGLESLFRSSMKMHPNAHQSPSTGTGNEEAETNHGALVHVDHMNDAKGYRKWLSKTCRQKGVELMIRQCFAGRLIIIVGLFGPQDAISAVLQQWRCCNVDQDAKGRPCRERKMSVLVQDILDCPIPEIGGEELNTTREKLEKLILSITNNRKWIDSMNHLW